jgi:hypothetical protein
MVRGPTTGQAIQALFMHPKPNQDLPQIDFVSAAIQLQIYAQPIGFPNFFTNDLEWYKSG